jgi:hypothetical protein
MKQNEVPQDEHLLKVTKEIQYAVDENGNYVQIKSTGWDTKNTILKQAWEDIEDELEEARQDVIRGEKSPIYFYMKKNLLDVATLAAYTGFFRFTVKRHFKPLIFKKLNNRKLEKYAGAFNMKTEDLHKIPAEKTKITKEKL